MHIEMISIIGPAFFIIVLFWILFIEETFPGAGWFAFRINNVDMKVRILSFLLFAGGMFFRIAGKRLIGGVMAAIALCLLILCYDSD